jgi:hypothetical protein
MQPPDNTRCTEKLVSNVYIQHSQFIGLGTPFVEKRKENAEGCVVHAIYSRKVASSKAAGPLNTSERGRRIQDGTGKQSARPMFKELRRVCADGGCGDKEYGKWEVGVVASKEASHATNNFNL